MSLVNSLRETGNYWKVMNENKSQYHFSPINLVGSTN